MREDNPTDICDARSANVIYMTAWFRNEETRNAAYNAGFELIPPGAAATALGPIERYLPISVIPDAAGPRGGLMGDLGGLHQCDSFFRIRMSHGALWLLDYEYESIETVSDGSGGTRRDTFTYSGTVAALLDPRIVGDVDIRKDWKSGVGGALLNAFLWVPPFTIVKAFQYGWAPKDLNVGHDAFDDRFVVEASSVEAAQMAVTPALGQCLVDIAFNEGLRIRPGVALVRLPAKREHGQVGFTSAMQRLNAIVTAILSRAGAAPFR